jgi:hypothetical protein
MKTKLIALFIVFLLLTAKCMEAKSKVLLRFNLQKGSSYEMTMNMSNLIDQQMAGHPMKMDQQMQMVFVYTVLEVLPNQNFLIEYSMQDMSLNMNINGQEMRMGTKDTTQSNPMYNVFKGLGSHKLKMEINSRGQVLKVEGLDVYVNSIGQNPQLAQSMQMFTGEDNFKSFMEQTFNYFPEAEVKEGDKWSTSYKLPGMMNMESTMNFELASIEEDQVVLNVTSDVNLDSPIEQNGFKMNVKMTGTQTGSMTIDTSDGWLRESDLTQKFDMKMKMNNPQSGEEMEIPMLMNSVVKITVVKK